MNNFTSKKTNLPPGVSPIKPGPGQISVWDFPRPAKLMPAPHKIAIIFAGEALIETTAALMVIETSHPPTYYLPLSELRHANILLKNSHSSICEWKGQADYFDLNWRGLKVENCAWSYPDPDRDFAALRNHIAFYPRLMDSCYVDNEKVEPQPGGFYGGWVTSHYVGPFKGIPGSRLW